MAVIRIGSFLFPLLKSFIVWTKYSGVSPCTSPDSGCPSPFMRWHDPHANPLFPLPSVTMRGAGPCAFGNQSGGAFKSSICGIVKLLLLPSTVNCPSSFSASGGLLTTMFAVGYAQPRSLPAGACANKAAAEITNKKIPIHS